MANPKGNIDTLKHYTPKWRSGKTQTIRVPIALVPEIMDYAQKLDSETIQSRDTSEIRDILESALSLQANKGGAIKSKIREAIALLDSL